MRFRLNKPILFKLGLNLYNIVMSSWWRKWRIFWRKCRRKWRNL